MLSVDASELIRHLIRRLDALRCVKYLQGHHIPLRIVVQDKARTLLIALTDHPIAQDDREGIGPGIVDNPHIYLQYFSILLVRYTVTTSGGVRSTSTNTRIR